MDRLDIRQAETGDYPAVREVYYALTDEMANTEFPPGWEKDVYPTQDFLRDSIRRGELYLGLLAGELAEKRDGDMGMSLEIQDFSEEELNQLQHYIRYLKFLRKKD